MSLFLFLHHYISDSLPYSLVLLVVILGLRTAVRVVVYGEKLFWTSAVISGEVDLFLLKSSWNLTRFCAW